VFEYEQFVNDYDEEEEEDDEAPPGLQLDGIAFKNFTEKIKTRIEKLENVETIAINNCK